MTKSKDAIIKDFLTTAQKAGLGSFVVGFDLDGLVSTHLEKIQMNSLSRITIFLFNQLCEHEISLGDPAYKGVFGDLKKDFSNLIQAHNAKCEKIKSTGKTKSS